MARKVVTGKLCVYRESSQRETLSAYLKVEDKTYEYYNCPKCFEKLQQPLKSNLLEISVTINEDGSNPRNPTLIKEL